MWFSLANSLHVNGGLLPLSFTTCVSRSPGRSSSSGNGFEICSGVGIVERAPQWNVQGYLLLFLPKHIILCSRNINCLIIELCFSSKTWFRQIWYTKLKEELPDCENLSPFKMDKTEGNIHSLYNNVFRSQHLSQNHRMTVVGRVLWRSLGPMSLPEQVHLKQVAQDSIQMGVELHHISISVLCHLQRNSFSFFLLRSFPYLSIIHFYIS